MTLFRKDWRDIMVNDVSPAIDRELGGEMLRIIPTTRKPNMPAEVDKTKAAITIPGVFSYRDKLSLTSNNVPVQTRDPVACFGHYALGAFDIGTGYIIERCDGTAFEVTAVKPDGVSSITCDLVQRGRAKTR